MIGIDTNVVIRVLTGDDESQAAAARQFLESMERTGDRAFVTLVGLAEVSWVLRRGYGCSRSQIAEAIQKLLESEPFEVEAPPVVTAALVAYKSGGADFADYLILFRNLFEGNERLVTFDATLARVPGVSLLS